MPFPTDPDDNEQHTNALGTIYQYDIDDDKWYIVNTVQLDPIIYPIQDEGYGGFIPITIYGQTYQVAFSDTNASVMYTFYVEFGGNFVIMLIHDGTGANAGKTASGKLYESNNIAGGAGGWNVSGANWDIALGNAINTLFADYGTPINIPANSRVGAQWAKDNNAGGAAGFMNVYGMILVRQ